MTTPPTSKRTRYEGLRKIAQFNWPFYLMGSAVLVASWLALMFLENSIPRPVFWLGATGLLLAAWWLIASLLASHWIYDRSGIYDFAWLELAPPRRAAILTAGFDESATGLQTRWPESDWSFLDFFDKTSMSEPSIQRARELYPLGAEWYTCSASKWPCTDGSFDLIVFSFSAHELRSSAERVALFREAKRNLAEGGAILVVEHLRDVPNAVVFGPGFLHFHSEKTWLRDFRESGLTLERTLNPTTFVKAFVAKS